MRTFLFTITDEHVGHSNVRIRCDSCGHTENHYVASAIGPVQKQDVGKRVYRVDGVIQVENNEQRDKRMQL